MIRFKSGQRASNQLQDEWTMLQDAERECDGHNLGSDPVVQGGQGQKDSAQPSEWGS
jgi:hypothetical protein